LKFKLISCIALLVPVLSAPSAFAQTAASPVVELGYGGLVTGTASVKNTGPFVGAEAGMRVWKSLDVFLEGGKFDDVVPQSQIDVATPLVTRLTQTQGQTAAATVKMPASYFGVGARWVFENHVIGGWVRPYVQFSAGGARVKREPTFTLAGADITSSLPSYGVVLGQDLTLQEKAAAYSFGVGALVPWRYLYVDVGYRSTRIQIDDAIGINRFHFAIGGRF
jgi:hypothetical protein